MSVVNITALGLLTIPPSGDRRIWVRHSTPKYAICSVFPRQNI